MDVTILHNPRCSKSRATLDLLHDRGVEPAVTEYLKDPPSEDELREIVSLLDVSVRDIVRTGEQAYKDLGLAGADDETLLAAMVAHPVLIQRPIVIANGKAAIGRPPETVLDIL